jgi:hypothetical protein
MRLAAAPSLTASSDNAEPPLPPPCPIPPFPPVAIWNSDKVPVVDPETELLRLTDPPLPGLKETPAIPPAPPVAEAETLTLPDPD